MKKQTILLVFIFVLVFGLRVFFAFQTPTLDHEAYFSLRQVNSISETGFPIVQDDLSYGGRVFVFSPTFYYFLAFFDLFLPTIFVLKVIPNLFASSIVIIVYFISKKITKSIDASLFSAFVAAFIPIFISETLNNASPYAIVIPLTFLSLFFLMQIKPNHVLYFLISAFVLTVLHPSSLLFIIGLLLYLLMVKLERLKIDRIKIEIILFLTFFSMWINFLIYKKAFLLHSISVIWQNIPSAVLSIYFGQTEIIQAVIAIGLVPVILGAYIIYRYLFREKNKDLYLLIALGLACFFLVWAKLLQPEIAFMFLGIILAVLFGQGYHLFFKYLKDTRFADSKNYFLLLLVFVFVGSSIGPSVYLANQKMEQTPSVADINALLWIKEETKPTSVVAASLEEGHMITAIAQRRNIMDSDFFLIKNPAQRFDDLRAIYRSHYKTEAVPLLNKYKVDYIFISNTSKAFFGIDKLDYIDEACFSLVFDEGAQIYESLCEVEEL